VTVFRNRLREDAREAYADELQVVTALARSMPGFAETKLFVSEDGERWAGAGVGAEEILTQSIETLIMARDAVRRVTRGRSTEHAIHPRRGYRRGWFSRYVLRPASGRLSGFAACANLGPAAIDSVAAVGIVVSWTADQGVVIAAPYQAVVAGPAVDFYPAAGEQAVPMPEPICPRSAIHLTARAATTDRGPVSSTAHEHIDLPSVTHAERWCPEFFPNI
jgi:hypothetical protein